MRRVLGLGYSVLWKPPLVPIPDFALYADVPSSITDPGGVINTWGQCTQSNPSNRPLFVLDTVTGISCVRTDTNTYLVAPSGALDFASQGAVSFALVFRQRQYTSATDYVLFDTTNGGTQAGVQIVAKNTPGVTNIRQLIARVFNGTSWIVDFTASGPTQAYQSLIWSIAIISITSTTLTVSIDGCQWLSTTFAAITFPSVSAAPATIGKFMGDFLAIEVWRGGNLNVLSTTARLQTRFNLPYKPVLLWTDLNLGETDPSGCTLSDNTFLALSTHNPGPGTNIGVIQARTSPDGFAWTPSPGDGTNPGMVLPFTAPVGGGMFDSVCESLSNGSVITIANQTTLNNVRALTAANPAAVRSNTWTNERVLTQGTPALEISAGQLCEDPSNPGTVYFCVYRQEVAEKWSIWMYRSTDYGATFPSRVKVADGAADGINYAEGGVTIITAATAAKYSDLPAGTILVLVRDDAHDTMLEFTSSSFAGPFTRRATSLIAFSAARFRQLQDGTFVTLLRDVIYQFNTLYRRTGVVGGVAQYTSAPAAPAVLPAFLNSNIGQYGNILKEVTAGLPLIITAARLDVNRCDTYARFFPEWQMSGRMPATISPSSASLSTGQTQTFVAQGAGNWTFSLPGDPTGSSINSSTGVFTTGAITGSCTVRATDLNGWHVDATVTVAGSGVGLPDTANMLFNFDASTGVTGSGNTLSVANQNGGATVATPPTGLAPAYGTTTLNGHNTLDFAGGKILRTTLPSNLTDMTYLAVFQTGSSIAGPQTLGGNAIATAVFRLDGGIPKVIDYVNGTAIVLFSDLSVAANSAHTLVFRKTAGVWECWLDGTKSTVVSSNVGTNPWGITPAFSLGNDDAGTLFGEQYLGQKAQDVLWGISESTGNVATAFTAMRGKWNTP